MSFWLWELWIWHHLWICHLGNLVDQSWVVNELDGNVINAVAGNSVFETSVDSVVSAEVPWFSGLAVPSSSSINGSGGCVHNIVCGVGKGDSSVSASLPSGFKERSDSFVMAAVVVAMMMVMVAMMMMAMMATEA